MKKPRTVEMWKLPPWPGTVFFGAKVDTEQESKLGSGFLQAQASGLLETYAHRAHLEDTVLQTTTEEKEPTLFRDGGDERIFSKWTDTFSWKLLPWEGIEENLLDERKEPPTPAKGRDQAARENVETWSMMALLSSWDPRRWTPPNLLPASTSRAIGASDFQSRWETVLPSGTSRKATPLALIWGDREDGEGRVGRLKVAPGWTWAWSKAVIGTRFWARAGNGSWGGAKAGAEGPLAWKWTGKNSGRF